KAGWEILLNRAGTTFKKLPDKDKAGLSDAKAISLMMKQPSMIKRPVLDAGGGKLLVCFNPGAYKAALTTRRHDANCRSAADMPDRAWLDFFGLFGLLQAMNNPCASSGSI